MIPQELIDKRKELGITQEHIAKKLRTKAPAIARMEHNKRYSSSWRTLQRYAKVLGYTLHVSLIRERKT